MHYAAFILILITNKNTNITVMKFTFQKEVTQIWMHYIKRIGMKIVKENDVSIKFSLCKIYIFLMLFVRLGAYT